MTSLPLPRRLFGLGIVATSPAAMELLGQHNVRPGLLLDRHTCGDWSDMAPAEIRANTEALRTGSQSVIGRYEIAAAEAIVVLTDPDSLTLLVTASQARIILRAEQGAGEVSLARWTPPSILRR